MRRQIVDFDLNLNRVFIWGSFFIDGLMVGGNAGLPGWVGVYFLLGCFVWLLVDVP